MWEDQPQGSPQEQQPAAPPSKPDAAGGKGKDPDNISLTKKEYDAILRERDELRQSERYWAEQVRQPRRAEPEPEPEPEEDIFADIPDIEEMDPEKFTDELTAKGRKALEDMGFVDKKRMKVLFEKQEQRFMKRMEGLVGQKITGAQQAMLKDAELLSTYPELNDAKSPFFTRTQEVYRELIADEPQLRKSGAGLKIAARMVRAELGKDSRRRADVDSRIARQQGDHTGFDGDDDSDDLTPAQKRILEKFNEDGGIQISEEAYKRRAKSGVNMATGNYHAGSMRWS